MRLTLRTLLAYRDGVLSQADTEDMHRRIQSSQDAGNLLKRIGAVTKMNQVTAPALNGKGLGGDPNSIAEYLDDALQHTQIPDLERVCLVSDMQLAELADCHTLLATAMNTKVSVPVSLRRSILTLVDAAARGQIRQELETRRAPRRQRLVVASSASPQTAPEFASAAVTTDLPVEVASPMLASGGVSIKPQGLNLENTALAHEVPEYLVGAPATNWKTPVAIGGLTALLFLLVWQALGPWEQVVQLFTTAPRFAHSDPSASEFPDLDVISETEQVPPGLPQEPEAAEVDVTVDESAPPGLPTSPTEPTMPPTAGVSPPAPTIIDPTEISAEAPPGLPSADVAVPEATAPNSTSPSAVGSALWLPADDAAAQAVLLVESDSGLKRVMAGEPLTVPTKLIVPPATRTTIDLPGGVLWTACGPSILNVQHAPMASSDNATSADVPTAFQPVVQTILCRALVRSGPDGRAVTLETPAGNYRIEMASPESLVSIEVTHRLAKPGPVTDLQLTSPVLVVIAAEGDATIAPADATGPPQVLRIGDGFAAVAGRMPQTFRLQQIPSWFLNSVERPIETLAARDLDQQLSLSTPNPLDLRQRLNEIGQSRRPETAAMAVQLSLLSGQWELLAGSCGNERLRSHWTPILNLARQLLAADPQAAVQLKMAWTDQLGAEGATLYELLCGLPSQQLEADGLAKLIGLLESPRLETRVLANYQLQLLTGKSLGFQPASPNRASVQQWRRDLATNRLTILQPPDLVWESLPR